MSETSLGRGGQSRIESEIEIARHTKKHLRSLTLAKSKCSAVTLTRELFIILLTKERNIYHYPGKKLGIDMNAAVPFAVASRWSMLG